MTSTATRSAASSARSSPEWIDASSNSASSANSARLGLTDPVGLKTTAVMVKSCFGNLHVHYRHLADATRGVFARPVHESCLYLAVGAFRHASRAHDPRKVDLDPVGQPAHLPRDLLAKRR